MLAITTIFVREHNRRARLIESANPDWDDDQIYQEARK
jgi:prostaglandin-endoperoxide synthase 2